MRRKPDQTQINANDIKNAGLGASVDVRSDPNPPNVGPPKTPQNARGVNPLSGSPLMKESAGRIRLLFPPDAGKDPSSLNRLNAQPIQIGITRFDLNGDLFKVLFNDQGTTDGSAIPWIRFYKNTFQISDWLPLMQLMIGQIVFGEPVSPLGAATVTNQAMAGGPINVNPLNEWQKYRISFDRFEIATKSVFNFQAMLYQGNADYF